MYLYLELWTARPAWRALSVEARKAYIDSIGPAIGQLLASGIELLGFSVVDQDTMLGSEHTYLGAWRMPSKELAVMLEQAVHGAGWHDYFVQVNARGAIMETSDVFAHMIGAD